MTLAEVEAKITERELRYWAWYFEEEERERQEERHRQRNPEEF